MAGYPPFNPNSYALPPNSSTLANVGAYQYVVMYQFVQAPLLPLPPRKRRGLWWAAAGRRRRRRRPAR